MISEFLNECDVEDRLTEPLTKLMSALRDAERGVKNPITARSMKGHKGRPLGQDEINLKVFASAAVTTLGDLSETKKEAYDIAAEASGLQRDELVKFRQSITPGKKGNKKRSGPKEAQRLYDMLMDLSPESLSDRELDAKVLLDMLRVMRDFNKN